MMLLQLLFVLVLGLGHFGDAETLKTNPPFWKAKPEVYKKITEERSIIVSAHAGAAKPPSVQKEELSVMAVGLVRVPLESAYSLARDFEKLPNVDERFVESRWNKSLNELFLHVAAYGYHARMTLKVNERAELNTDPKRKIMEWESIGGSFVGMKGVIAFEDYKRQATEISMTAQYASAKLPLPSILMGFGLEVVAQRAAAAMRSYIEKEYAGGKGQRL